MSRRLSVTFDRGTLGLSEPFQAFSNQNRDFTHLDEENYVGQQ
jgi:hypothetical protein